MQRHSFGKEETFNRNRSLTLRKSYSPLQRPIRLPLHFAENRRRQFHHGRYVLPVDEPVVKKQLPGRKSRAVGVENLLTRGVVGVGPQGGDTCLVVEYQARDPGRFAAVVEEVGPRNERKRWLQGMNLRHMVEGSDKEL